MSPWHTLTILASRPAADGLFHLSLGGAPASLHAQHTRPGQYVKLHLEGQPDGFFALAAPPGQGPALEFLIKRSGPLSEALAALPVGAPVQVSLPMGRGFPLEAARGHDLLLFAAGSGISALRPVVEAVRAERAAFGEVTLFYGVRTPGGFAYQADFPAWERDRVRVVQVVSQPPEGYSGLRGRVQEHLSGVAVANAVAFLVGQKAMVQDVTAALVARGLPKERVLLNF